MVNHLEAKLSVTCTGAGGKERHGEMFSAKAQRMQIYLSVKLLSGMRCWAHRSRRPSSRVGTHTESGPESAHMSPCSYRETCCTDPWVTVEEKTHMKMWQMQKKQHSENKFKMQRKNRQYWFPMALERAGHFPSISQVLYWQSLYMPRKVQVFTGINPRWQHHFKILTPHLEGGSSDDLVWENWFLSQTSFLVPPLAGGFQLFSLTSPLFTAFWGWQMCSTY